MISLEATLTGGKIVRHWDVSQIRTANDAKQVSPGDIIVHKEMEFEVTWLGTDNTGLPVFMGRLYGNSPWPEKLEAKPAPNHTLFAWGPKGIAPSYPAYKEGKMILPEKPVNDYLYDYIGYC